jgi:hypothetical protein
MQFVALTTLNERLTEHIRGKDEEIKEIHRKLLSEMDTSKNFERESTKHKMGSERLSDILQREEALRQA